MSVIYYGLPVVFVAGVLFIFIYLFVEILTARCSECMGRNTKDAVFCSTCGVNLTGQQRFSEDAIFSRSTIVLAFFIPFLGIYLWLQFRYVYPHRSKSLALLATIGSVISLANATFGGFGLTYGLYNFY